MTSQTETLKIKYFLPFNIAITKICVAIRLVEDGTRMGYPYRLSPSLNNLNCSNGGSPNFKRLLNDLNNLFKLNILQCGMA